MLVNTFKCADEVDVALSMSVGGRSAITLAEDDDEIMVGVMGVNTGLPLLALTTPVVANKSVPTPNGSSADCEDKLNTEPQLMGRVQSLSSPKPLSASEWGLPPLLFIVLGNGVARPEDASRNKGCGWSYGGRESLNGMREDCCC